MDIVAPADPTGSVTSDNQYLNSSGHRIPSTTREYDGADSWTLTTGTVLWEVRGYGYNTSIGSSRRSILR